MGEEEIKLVRKKLKWPHPAFEIPKNILNEWRAIGSNGILLEKDWLKELNKSKENIKNKFNNFNNKIFRDELNDLIFKEKEKYFNDNLRWLLDNVL